MSRVHDMGGRFGDGAVVPEAEDGPRFAEDWHRGALALTLAAGAAGRWNIDASRHARESLAPRDYARFGYYEKWLAALADLLVARGLITREELAAGEEPATGGAPARPLSEVALRGPNVAAALARRVPYSRPGPAPRFAVGDRVLTRLPSRNRLVTGGHTRLPGYAAGHLGRIMLSHGPHVFPDSNAHGLGEAPEPLYTVAFEAARLWGEAEHPGDEVTLDLWESYLEPA